METNCRIIQYPDKVNAMPNMTMISPSMKVFLEFKGNQPLFVSRDLIFSRIASITNSERLRYAYSGCSRMISSTLSRIVSGIFTVVYVVAIHSNYIKNKLTVGSNNVVIHSNHFKGGID